MYEVYFLLSILAHYNISSQEQGLLSVLLCMNPKSQITSTQ